MNCFVSINTVLYFKTEAVDGMYGWDLKAATFTGDLV